ncbi:hypothetical protein TSUD_81460 [Trifolium subterraneum]|uniref:Retrotransposon Copia-like N-terminal domain-containing protein n=1 Tax=Trifolium subterraneum TaxID=3900 RepID=A0A2Z6PR41_TRISU|nr:hypothetical protein TSUD_81460 [Trifolium subterraneum]
MADKRLEPKVLPQNKGYQNDILNPYFMHPNENPGNILATPLLSGPNYHSWSRAVTVALRSKHKIHFINGSLPRPPDEDRDSIAWDRCNTVVMSWLSNSVEPEISQSILWMDTTSEIWKKLKERFYQGLNDNYSAVRSQIMLMEPLPNIGKVYSLLVQQERQSLLFSDEPKILAATGYNVNGRGSSSSRGRGERGGKPPYGRGKGNKVCTFCGMTNHVVDECFKKHGFPPHMQSKGMVNNCHTNGVEEDSKSIAYEEDNGDMDTGKLVFTPDQHKALLALLQNSNNVSAHSINHITSQPSSSTVILCTIPLISKPNDSFILDTGATDHVCHSLKYFQCMKKIHPINIKLPNGALVSTDLAGTILFDKNLYITNDTLSKRMIGAAKMHHGLYILTTPLTNPVCLPVKQSCQVSQQFINALDTLDKDSVVKNKDRNNDCIL